MTTHHESSDDEQSTNPFAYHEPASRGNGGRGWSELIDDPDDAAFRLVLKTLQRRVTFLPFLVMLLISILQLLCVLSPFILALFGHVDADEPIVAIAIASFLVFLLPTLVSIPLTIALGFRKIGALYAGVVISLIPLFLTLALWVLLSFSTGGGKFMLVPFVIAAGGTFLFVWAVFRYRRQYEQLRIDNRILY